MPDLELISHGAEAKIYRCNDFILKYRLSKTYRLTSIDKMLIERRTRSEMNILNKLHHYGVAVPMVHNYKKIEKNKLDKQKNVAREKDNEIQNKKPDEYFNNEKDDFTNGYKNNYNDNENNSEQNSKHNNYNNDNDNKNNYENNHFSSKSNNNDNLIDDSKSGYTVKFDVKEDKKDFVENKHDINIKEPFEIKLLQISDKLSLENLTVKNTILMEYIPGTSLKEYINSSTLESRQEIFNKLGKLISKIHELNIIHGDITTMNFIVNNCKIYAIDFGLSYTSNKDENKAVDLYVFERAVICSHGEEVLDYFYETYKNEGVLKKLVEVRRRGRKREETAIG
ncbi:TP53 regulating kinase [Conglomerata obtusa]